MASVKRVDNDQSLVGKVVNNPIYSAVCRYYGTARGCRYGVTCRWMHINRQPEPTKPIEHEKLESMLLNKQSSITQRSTDDVQLNGDDNESISSIQGMVSRMQIPVHISADVIYSGVFLDKLTQEHLRKYFSAVSGEELLNTLTDCHLTLSWNPENDHVDALPFGSKVKLKAVGICSDSYLQSLVMEILDPVVHRLFVNSHSITIPHITVSFNNMAVRPDYSNVLLEEGYVPIPDRKEDAVFEGTVGAYYQEPFYGLHFKRIPRSVVHVYY